MGTAIGERRCDFATGVLTLCESRFFFVHIAIALLVFVLLCRFYRRHSLAFFYYWRSRRLGPASNYYPAGTPSPLFCLRVCTPDADADSCSDDGLDNNVNGDGEEDTRL
jgi:hypothetical protein